MSTPTIRPLDWGEWGVWDKHARRWLVSGLANEREAWLALLDAEHPYRWRLDIRRIPDPDNLCCWCGGDGVEVSGKDCHHCGGSGEEPEEDDWDDEEEDDE